MADQLNSSSRLCYYQLRQKWIIQYNLSFSAAETLVRSFVLMHFAYCNSIPAGHKKFRKHQLLVHPQLHKLTNGQPAEVLSRLYWIMRDKHHWVTVENTSHDAPSAADLFSQTTPTDIRQLMCQSQVHRASLTLLVLWQCKFQAWIKEKGDANRVCYHLVKLQLLLLTGPVIVAFCW